MMRGLELSTIYAKGIYERHKMVYNLDLSRAFDTKVGAYRSCSSSWAAAGLYPSSGAYQRKTRACGGPLSCRVSPLCVFQDVGADAARRQAARRICPGDAPLGRATSPSALPL